MKFLNLYAFGSNGGGQLGTGHEDDVHEPQRCVFEFSHGCNGTTKLLYLILENPENPLNEAHSFKLVAGGNHTILLVKDGSVTSKLFSTGNNADGRCGMQLHQTIKNTCHFIETCVTTPPRKLNVKDIAATWEASFFTDGTEVYCCGIGKKGELGLGAAVTSASFPTPIPGIHTISSGSVDNTEHIVKITASLNHVVILMSDGTMVGWGANGKGQLGQDSQHDKTIWTPKPVDVPFFVSDVVVGQNFTFLWGGSTKDCIVLGDLKNHQLLLENLPHDVSQVLSGWSSLVFRDGVGHLFGIGKSNLGQLPPTDLGSTKTFAVGSEHGIALLQDESLVAWGWGEHGNCGLPVNERGCVAQRWNQIVLPPNPYSDSKHVIQGVAAGCATSFVWTVHEIADTTQKEAQITPADNEPNVNSTDVS